MPRSVWKGSLSFGLVNVPVGLYAATADKTLHFHQVEAGTSDRIRYKKVNERTGQEVAPEDIELAMDMGGGEYVIVSEEELAEAAPEKSRTIDIEGFVDLADIDPIFFRSTYYLAPQSDAGTKPYHLLREAMETSGKIGVATFVMRNKEYLVAIRPEPDVLALETMYFADEIRDPLADLPHLTESGQAKPRPKERDMAQLLIDSLAERWNPADYHDSYREHVQQLLDEKQAGHETVTHVGAERVGKVIDLLEALQASVKKAGGRATASAKKGGATKKAPAKSTAPRKKASKATSKTTRKAPAQKRAAPAARRKAS
jgi:DNA end-binding protein Ku